MVLSTSLPSVVAESREHLVSLAAFASFHFCCLDEVFTEFLLLLFYHFVRAGKLLSCNNLLSNTFIELGKSREAQDTLFCLLLCLAQNEACIMLKPH